MMVDVINRKRKVVEQIQVHPELLQGPINRLIMSDAVRAQLANLRQGNAATKTRGDVNLTNRKIYRQKGTGNARHGSRKAPVFVGGGTVFGPHPRDYTIALPKKMRSLAFLSALRLKFKEGKFLIVNDLSFAKPKTKDAGAYFTDLAVSNAAVVLPVEDNATAQSIRNIPHLRVAMPQGLSLLDLFKSDYVVVTPESLRSIESRFFKEVQ